MKYYAIFITMVVAFLFAFYQCEKEQKYFDYLEEKKKADSLEKVLNQRIKNDSLETVKLLKKINEELPFNPVSADSIRDFWNPTRYK